VRGLVKSAEPPLRRLVLNAEAVTYVDSTAIETLKDLHGELADRGIVLGLARAKGPFRDVLDATGLTEELGSGNLFPSVRAAVAAFRERDQAPRPVPASRL
jgi:SulP family sulfate permease